MANIKKHLDNIKGALFGKEVRSSIHDGIDAINKEVESTTNRQEHLEGTFDQLIINSGNSNAEIVDARVGENGKSYAKLGDRLDEVDSQLEHIAKEQINVLEFGAKGDGVNDDTQSINNAIENAIRTGILKVFFPPGVYRITSTIQINSPVTLIGSGCRETINTTVIKKDKNFVGIEILSRDVSIYDLEVQGDVTHDTCDGIIIGGSGNDRNAQGCTLKNVLVRNNGNNGITLKQCNNGFFDNIICLYNKGNGFSMEATTEANYSGNVINVINSFGNGKCGANISGEGNKVYVCSQSNTEDNLRLSDWCTNCDIMGYTEYAKNGYEINVTGNGFANNIKGTYRSKNNKVYKSLTGLVNNLNFTQNLNEGGQHFTSVANEFVSKRLYFLKGLLTTPFTHNGYLEYNNGLKFVDSDENSREIAYKSIEKILFNGGICNNESGYGGNVFLNDSNGQFDTTFNVFEDGVIYGVTTTLKEEITNDMVQVFVYVNDLEIVNSYHFLNNSTGKTVNHNLNINVSKGDVISIKVVWFNNVSPRNNKAKVVLYKK